MHSKVYIVSECDTDAALYAYEFVFKIFFGTELIVTSSGANIPDHSTLISHGVDGIANSFFIPFNGFLQKTFALHPKEIGKGEWGDLPSIFPGKGDVSFDIFSAIFYLLARVEEYAVSGRDQHGRFQFKNSILAEPGFEGRPIIDLWLIKLGQTLEAKFPEFKPAPRKFKWINTFDIDIAYAYSHRSPLRMVAATGKNVLRGDFSSVAERLKVLLKALPDPFDTYAFQEDIVNQSKCQAIYFFLLGSGGKMDRNISPSNQKFQKLIQHISTYADVGIHPSYLSGDKPEELTQEIKYLSQIIGKPITQSRQHFLRMKLPITYRRLLKEGIEKDYTMGYAEQLAFRSGTCTPHVFFDFEANCATSLKVYPLTAMEGTLRDYMKLSPEEAKRTYQGLIDMVREVKGTFISLWHNDSLMKESPWRGVYQFMSEALNKDVNQKED